MRKNISIFLAFFVLLSGCISDEIERGKITKNGNIFYVLCERGKQRVNDLRSMSFDLPELFRQAPCTKWPDYVVDTKSDDMTVEIPSFIDRGNLRAIGPGGYGMMFKPGTIYSEKWQQWDFINGMISPETFLQDWKIKNQRIKEGGAQLESGFVDAWQGGRCLRLATITSTYFDYRYEVEYYCWPSSGGASKAPFYIRAAQSIPNRTKEYPPKSAFTDIDKELIQPVLDSLQLTPVPEEVLLQWAEDRKDYCAKVKEIYDGKKENIFDIDFPDRRRLILKMRDCGNDVPDPPSAGIDNWNVVLELDKYGPESLFYDPESYRDYEYLSTVTITQNQKWNQFRVSKEKFARIKARILGFDLLKESEPVRKAYKDRNDVFYDAWYYVPPGYKRTTEVARRIPAEEVKHGWIPTVYPETVRAGVGFYYSKELNAPAIDINLDGSFGPLTLIEGD